MALGYLISPVLQIEDVNGKPLVGGHLTVYKHGTSIPYITYKDFDGDHNPAEVVLDAKGMAILLAEEGVYDVYCTDRNYVEQWSRQNVTTGGSGSGGGGGSADITSSDGSITIIRTGDTVDLSVTDTEPSAIVAQSEIRTDSGPFTFPYDPINVIGHDISLANARVTCAKRWYHYDATIKIDWIGTPQNQTIELTVSAPDTFERVEFDLSYPHSEWLTLSADYEIQHNGDHIALGISGFPLETGLSAQVYNVSVHTLVGRLPSSGGVADIYTDSTLSGDGTAENPLSVVGSPFQAPIITYNGCGIALNNNVIEADVRTDSTLNGAGTSASPLGVAAGAIGRQQLTTDVKNDIDSKISTVVTDGVTITGDGTVEAPLVAVGGGSTYGEGVAIDIDANDDINVKYGDGLDVNQDNELEVQLGDGLTFEDNGGIKVITVDSDVSDVVATVQKLKHDLDTQITVNFAMPNISQVYDFADESNWVTAQGSHVNGAAMLYQSFSIPINHDIRTLSEDAHEPTLLGLYAQQSFAHKVMLALYEYTYAVAGESAGSSTYVGDTGPVSILQGVNEFPLKNRNPSISELRSDRVYYAALYMQSTAFVNGLFLAGCPSYGNVSVPAQPRLSCCTENITWQGQELNMDDPTTTLNHYQVIEIPGQPVYYQYYIGPWVGGYNERWSSPRFYMQIRNGEWSAPVIPTVPFETLGDSVLPRGGILASNLPNFSATSSNSGFRDVTPLTAVTITAFEWIDSMQSAQGWEAGNCVFSSDYSTNLSGNSNTVTDLGQVVQTANGVGYAHRITFTSPITLSANTTYRFLCTSFSSSSDWIWSWAEPTNVYDATNNGWYVDWSSNISRYSHIAGQYVKLYDSNNNHYVI